MIVRDEAHVIDEVLVGVAPFISSWVIVDTGSVDGTREVIRHRMAELGIPGELHDRPWHDFGFNRSEALRLAQGRADYIWVIDADDLLVGTPDLSEVRGDVYAIPYREGSGLVYWRRQVFRDGMPWRYVGAVHEYADCDAPFVEERLPGDFHVESRRLGGRNLDPRKYERDRDLLLAAVEAHPNDARSMFYLAQSYFDLGDFARARDWYARRTELGGWDEETYFAMYRVAESMAKAGDRWPEVQHWYLRAWEFRPTRAEPLYAIAFQYRTDARYELGYLFAERAAAIPKPDDVLFVSTDVYAWRARDEQAVCASWIGKEDEAILLLEWLLQLDDIPDGERTRIEANLRALQQATAAAEPPTEP